MTVLGRRDRSSGLPLACAVLLLAGCSSRGGDPRAVEATIARYNELLRDGYERQNMTFMREVATDDQAQRLYNHMAALGEGKLRMSSRLERLELVRVELPARDEATAETREVWDFTHYRTDTGERFAEERGFVYRIAYGLRRVEGNWKVARADVISGEATNTVIPWPEPDRPGAPHAGAPSPAPPPRQPGGFERRPRAQ